MKGTVDCLVTIVNNRHRSGIRDIWPAAGASWMPKEALRQIEN
jgi:hypothetical protein